MTKEETAALVATAKELWPGTWDISEATFRVWHAVLADVDYTAATEAMMAMAVTQHFYPRPGPADVWRQVHHVTTPDLEEAWQVARGYLSLTFPDVGVYPPPQEDQSLPARAYRMAGGYPVVNDARRGRDAFVKAWEHVVADVAEQIGAELPRQITERRHAARRQVERRHP